jgi:tetratricopeptide (TPR) repeat protein
MASSARIDELKKKFDENPRRYFAPLANEYRKVGDLDQALFICEAYLPQQPGHMSGHIVYAQTLFEMGRYDDSKAAFGTALALDPENLIALRHLGDIARHAGDLNTAREWYQRVLEADPRNEEIVEVMASLRQAQSGGAAPASPMASAAPAEVSPSMPTPAMSTEPPALRHGLVMDSRRVSTRRHQPLTISRRTTSSSTSRDGDRETPRRLRGVSTDPANDDAAFESIPFAIAATGPHDIEPRDRHSAWSLDDGRNRMSRRLRITAARGLVRTSQHHPRAHRDRRYESRDGAVLRHPSWRGDTD